MMRKRLKEQQPAPSRDALSSAANVVRKYADVPAGLVDPRKHLDAGEQHELVAFAARLYRVKPHRAGVDAVEHVFDRDALDAKEWRRWLALCAKSVGDPDLFTRREEEAKVQAGIRELSRAMNPAQKRPRYEEEGSIILPQRVFEHVKNGALQVEGLGVLAFFLLQLENREALSFRADIDGDQVVFEREYVTMPGDAMKPGSDIVDGNAQNRMSHTQVCRLLDLIASQPPTHRWLEVTKSGPTWRVRLGPAYLAAIETRTAA